MKISHIATKREWQHNYAYDLIYEWEDVFSSIMEVPLFDEKKLIYNRFFKLVPIIPAFLQSSKMQLEFEMECISSHWFVNRKRSIIPFVIDFYPQEKGLYGIKMFNFLYKCHPVVFISSKEVYDYLKSLGSIIKVNIVHVALSISDKYKLTKNSKLYKKYDLVLMGRQSSVFIEYLNRYKETHPDFFYVYNQRIDGKLLYYTSDGTLLDDINTREKYIELMKQARCAFYTTPGIDGEKETHGFNQVTPRFLELISCGCHILARYKENSDSHFYELEKFCRPVVSYEQFEKELDYGRSHDVDIEKYANYLEKHYTSVRAKQVKEIIRNL